jgi:methionyl-tRNA formyltransferase
VLNILLIGGTAGARVLSTLDRRGHPIGWVIDTDPTPSGQASLGQVALSQGRTVWPAATIKDSRFAETASAAGIDVILSVRCRLVLPAALLEAPRFGSYNLHHGPLPQYAGRNVVSWALYNGEAEHGVTLHRMVAAVDRGGIVSAARFAIGPDDTALTLSRRCLTKGLPLLTQLLDRIEETGQPPQLSEQDLTEARYYSAKERPDPRLDWRQPTLRLLNLTRACAFHPFPSPWGLPVAICRGRTLEILRMRPAASEVAEATPGTVVATERGAAIIATGDGKIRLESFLIDGRSVDAADIVEAGDRFDHPS